jgi:hypothetical protein
MIPNIVRVDSQNRIVEPSHMVPQWERIQKSVASRDDF